MPSAISGLLFAFMMVLVDTKCVPGDALRPCPTCPTMGGAGQSDILFHLFHCSGTEQKCVLLRRGRVFFELDDEGLDGGGFGGVGEDAEEFFVEGYRVGIFFLPLVDQAEELVDDNCVGRA